MLLLDSRQRESERERIIKKERIACHFPLIDVSNYIIFSPLGRLGYASVSALSYHTVRHAVSPFHDAFDSFFFHPSSALCPSPNEKKKKKDSQ